MNSVVGALLGIVQSFPEHYPLLQLVRQTDPAHNSSGMLLGGRGNIAATTCLDTKKAPPVPKFTHLNLVKYTFLGNTLVKDQLSLTSCSLACLLLTYWLLISTKAHILHDYLHP